MKRLFFVLMIGVFIGCGNDKEGCLDIKANNYDASADENCCCTYPSVKLNITHQIDTSAFELGKAYPGENGLGTFKVDTLNILFSNIHLSNSTSTLRVKDTIHIGVENAETLVLEDNFVNISPSASSYSIGTYDQVENYSTLNMTFGLDENLNAVIPDSVHKKNHLLQLNDGQRWTSSEGYYYIYMDVTPSVFSPTIKKQIVVAGNEAMQSLSLPANIETNVGYDIKIDLKIDYRKLFQGIDFVSDTEEVIKNKLTANLSASLTVE